MAPSGPDPLPDSTSRVALRFPPTDRRDRRMSRRPAPDPERRRLAEVAQGRRAWYRWGPYLSNRQWGTVREDYSADGDAWRSFPYEQAAARAYRWGEDGLLGLSDDVGDLCLAPAVWNGRDATVKRRLFGLSNPEGNHGEDVKELYYYLDGTPTASYLKALYRYPQAAFPYDELRQANAAPDAAGSGVRAARHGPPRRRPLLRPDRRVRQGRPGGHRGALHGGQPRPGGGARPRAPHAVVPQHVELGPGPPAPGHQPGPSEPVRWPCGRSTICWAATGWPARRPTRC